VPAAAPSPAYAELYAMSAFSFQHGASLPQELVARAKALGYAALALTDECSVAGVVRAHEAARAAGLSDQAIITRHIVPNLLGPVVVYVTLTIPAVILAESFLSFLGMGVQEPLTSLGTLISQGAQDMEAAPWLLIFPSLTMVATLMCLNFIGDGLRDAIDPKDR